MEKKTASEPSIQNSSKTKEQQTSQDFFSQLSATHPHPHPHISDEFNHGKPLVSQCPNHGFLRPKPSAMICADVEELGNSQRCNKSTTTASRRQTLGKN